MKGIRVQVIHGIGSEDLTKEVNRWLDENEDKHVIVSISPAMPMGHSGGGGYVTINYTTSENVLSVPVKSPEENA